MPKTKKICKLCQKLRDIKFFETPKSLYCIDCKKHAKTQKRKQASKVTKKKAWTAFSTYIRIRDSLKTTSTIDECVCITCGKRVPYKKIQAGHYIGGRGNSVLFDERIVNGQCSRCNIILKGNYDAYNLVMLKKYSKKEILKMLEKKKERKINTSQDYLDIEEKYKQKTKELLEKNREKLRQKASKICKD